VTEGLDIFIDWEQGWMKLRAAIFSASTTDFRSIWRLLRKKGRPLKVDERHETSNGLDNAPP